MPFREKSAWIMSVALLLGGLWYFRTVFAAGSEFGRLAPPVVAPILVFTACLVAAAVLGHIAIAALAPRDANAPIDEREQQIFLRAGHYSSYAFGFGVVASLALYVFSGSGDLLFYTVFASLLVGQVLEYLLQIFFYRTSV